jgi:hypothetical protein
MCRGDHAYACLFWGSRWFWEGEVRDVYKAAHGSFCVTAELIFHHIQNWFGGLTSWFEICNLAARRGGGVFACKQLRCGLETTTMLS